MKKSTFGLLLVGLAGLLFITTPKNWAAEAIPTITILSPNGGETIRAGGTIPIHWKDFYLYDNNEVSIYLVDSRNPGNDFPITENLFVRSSGIDGTSAVSWIVPSTITPGVATFKIEIREKKKLVTDQSDAYFTITPPLSLKNVRIWKPEGQGLTMTFEMQGTVPGQFYRLEHSVNLKEWKFLSLHIYPTPEGPVGLDGFVTENSSGSPFRFFRLVEGRGDK